METASIFTESATPETTVNPVETMLALWQNPENKPIKSRLVNMAMARGSDDGKPPLSCMCAHGQILYTLGGYSIDDLLELENDSDYSGGQDTADWAVAKIFGSTVSFAKFIRYVNDDPELHGPPSSVFAYPAQLLGDNYKSIFKFWEFIESRPLAELENSKFFDLRQKCCIYRTKLWNFFNLSHPDRKFRSTTWDCTSVDNVSLNLFLAARFAILEIAAMGSPFSVENPPKYLPIFESMGFALSGFVN